MPFKWNVSVDSIFGKIFIGTFDNFPKIPSVFSVSSVANSIRWIDQGVPDESGLRETSCRHREC